MITIKPPLLLSSFIFDIYQSILHAVGSPLAADAFRLTCWLNKLHLMIKITVRGTRVFPRLHTRCSLIRVRCERGWIMKPYWHKFNTTRQSPPRGVTGTNKSPGKTMQSPGRTSPRKPGVLSCCSLHTYTINFRGDPLAPSAALSWRLVSILTATQSL